MIELNKVCNIQLISITYIPCLSKVGQRAILLIILHYSPKCEVDPKAARMGGREEGMLIMLLAETLHRSNVPMLQVDGKRFAAIVRLQYTSPCCA